MWPWSDPAEIALSRGHTAMTRVDIWHSGRPVYSFPTVTGGSVSCASDRPVRRNLPGCTIIDASGELSQVEIKDTLLDPYIAEIAPWRGVRYLDANGNKVTEWAPQGVFGLTGRDVDDTPDGLTIQLTGQDRAMAYQGGMSSALAISGGTPIEDAIAALAVTRQPGVAMSAMSTGYPTGPLVFTPDIDVWAEMQKLAESVGGVVYHDRVGQMVFALRGPTNDNAVAAYAEGDGLLLSANRAEDSDTIKNVVVASTPDGRISVRVADDDPFSPTYAKGSYGERVFPLVNPHFSSVTQAQQAATARLAYELGRSETVTFTAVVDPGLDVDEVVTVHRPRAGLTQRGVVVASTEVPLSCEEAMSVGCRQSRLAPDGRVLREP